MTHKVLIISIILSFASALTLNAREVWRTHLSYNDVESITQTPNRVFALGSGSLFSLDKRDNSVEIFTRVNGLSDSDISLIKYDENSETLFIVYSNSNIDLMTTTRGIFNVPDLFRATVIGSKRVNHIFFNDNFAYLSTDFGIVVVNVARREIAATYIIGANGANVSVSSTAIWNDSIYAAVNNRIYVAHIGQNLSDFHNWTSREIFAEDENIELMEVFQDNMFLLTTSQNLYLKESPQSDNLSLFSDNVVTMSISQGRLNLTRAQAIDSYSDLSNKISLNISALKGLFDQNRNLFFLAGGGNGLFRINPDGTGVASFIPPGPVLNDPFTMQFSGGRLFVTTTGPMVGAPPGVGNIPGAVMIYDGRRWFAITNNEIPEAHRPFTDLLRIAINPSDPTHFFAGTWHRGLYEFRNDTFFQRFNYQNSQIELPYPDDPDAFQIIDGLAFDRNGNLWMTQSGTNVNNALKVLKRNGDWQSFFFPGFTGRATIQQILIDNNDFKWVNEPRHRPGLFVFDHRGTIENTADDRYRFFATNYIDQDGNRFSHGGSVRHMALDRRDPNRMWVATANGPIIIPDTRRAFDHGDLRIHRIKIPRNDGSGLADFLLENEVINWIEVDGGNRKWLATGSSGALLVSEDGTATLRHYTAENSPLLSNNVLSIAVHPETGEVFFGTDRGIISVMGDATLGNVENSFQELKIFPNPLREYHVGGVHIAGLEDRSIVKITDIAGNLVYQTISNGGMATWSGNNIFGHRVATGVYLVQVSSADNSRSGVGKILIVNN